MSRRQVTSILGVVCVGLGVWIALAASISDGSMPVVAALGLAGIGAALLVGGQVGERRSSLRRSGLALSIAGVVTVVLSLFLLSRLSQFETILMTYLFGAGIGLALTLAGIVVTAASFRQRPQVPSVEG